MQFSEEEIKEITKLRSEIRKQLEQRKQPDEKKCQRLRELVQKTGYADEIDIED